MSRKAKDLTKRELDALRRKAQRDPTFQTQRSDGAQAGLCVRARKGHVVFWFRVCRPGGKRVMRRIGNFGDLTLDQARETAQEWHGIKSTRRDVVQVLDEREREALTVADIVREYLGDFRQRAETGARRGKRSSYAEAERLLTSRVLPKLGSLPKPRFAVFLRARSLAVSQPSGCSTGEVVRLERC